MEKWHKRAQETEEYGSVMRQQELCWLAQESERNEQCYQQLRALYPEHHAELTASELCAAYASHRGYISEELANELKTHRLLQVRALQYVFVVRQSHWT